MLAAITGLQYNNKEIIAKRAEIGYRLMALSPNIVRPELTRLAANDLRILFQLYDEVFFNHQLAASFTGQLKFSLSSRLTKSAGKTIFPRYPDKMPPGQLTAEIRMGTSFFFQYDAVAGPKLVSGITTQNALEAFQLVFEHEICHFIEFVCFKTSNCRGKRFKNLAHNLFGHTDSYHKLPTQKQIALQQYGFQLGDPVSFTFEGSTLQGTLYRINKRATVMVKDRKGVYANKKGVRYSKYYVPIESLVSID
ncbi:MAG TPA: SprT-like domain-containing protein [Bacillota bacterium]|nr:SprT-like domain-containing protein [Bacillota bacterium]